MSVLDRFEVIDGGERQVGYDPVRTRRRKLAAALVEQIGLIDALEAGETYRKAVVRRRQDLETDEVVETTEQRTVPAWWRVDDTGQVHFALRYGALRLKVKDGKDTFVLPSLEALRDLLPPLRQEVLMGQLDGALADAAASLQTRFTPKKPPARKA
ncbi:MULTISPECIES: hypothetical protein [Brevundimonas]|uniref:hypothetical protein n=1 Tax=Brevundimonas sp. UBA7507 TaxID=1946137 RepID=UPI00257D6EC6|nr:MULTISPECIES: hypothetical protein [Brevundimonas]